MNRDDIQLITGMLNQDVRPEAIEQAEKILTEHDHEALQKAEEKRARKRLKALTAKELL